MSVTAIVCTLGTIAQRKSIISPQGESVTVDLSLLSSSAVPHNGVGGTIRLCWRSRDGKRVFSDPVAGNALGRYALTIPSQQVAFFVGPVKWDVWWYPEDGEPKQLIHPGELLISESVGPNAVDVQPPAAELANYATIAYVDEQIATVVSGGAPDGLVTDSELAEATAGLVTTAQLATALEGVGTGTGDVTQAELDAAIATRAPTVHAHAVYATTTQLDAVAAAKADTAHNHAGVYAPTAHTHDYVTPATLATALETVGAGEPGPAGPPGNGTMTPSVVVTGIELAAGTGYRLLASLPLAYIGIGFADALGLRAWGYTDGTFQLLGDWRLNVWRTSGGGLKCLGAANGANVLPIYEQTNEENAARADWSTVCRIASDGSALEVLGQAGNVASLWAVEYWANNPMQISSTAVPPDPTRPTITTFSAPSTATSLSVTITAAASKAVTWYLSEDGTLPGSPTWFSIAGTTVHTFATPGIKTLYAWARDGLNQVSERVSLTVTIAIADTLAPTITVSVASEVSDSSAPYIVPIDVFTLSEPGKFFASLTSAEPTEQQWSDTAPTQIEVPSVGTHTIYFHGSDLVGNWAYVTRTVAVSVPDETAPVITAFAIGQNLTTTAVPVTTLTIQGGELVDYFVVRNSTTVPTNQDAGWLTSAPTQLTGVNGDNTFRLYVRDRSAQQNISEAAVATTTITLPAEMPAIWRDKFDGTAGAAVGATWECWSNAPLTAGVLSGSGSATFTTDTASTNFRVMFFGSTVAPSALPQRGYCLTVRAPRSVWQTAVWGIVIAAVKGAYAGSYTGIQYSMSSGGLGGYVLGAGALTAAPTSLALTALDATPASWTTGAAGDLLQVTLQITDVAGVRRLTVWKNGVAVGYRDGITVNDIAGTQGALIGQFPTGRSVEDVVFTETPPTYPY